MYCELNQVGASAFLCMQYEAMGMCSHYKVFEDLKTDY